MKTESFLLRKMNQTPYILGVVVIQHGGAASCDVAPDVDIEAVDAPGAEAGNVARHLHMVTVHLGKHNPARDGFIVQDSQCRLDPWSLGPRKESCQPSLILNTEACLNWGYDFREGEEAFAETGIILG